MTVRSSALLRAAATGFLFSICATGWCAWETGPGLALFFGAIFLSALYLPPLTLAEEPPLRWISPATTLIGIVACWSISSAWIDVSPGELFRCALVCAAFVFALSGLACALTRLRLPPPLASGGVVVAALLWLGWPVWLSHGLSQWLVDALVVAHPLFAINAVLQHLGAWDRAPMAYQRLTILNQDIPYHLPRTVMPAVVLHGVIATIGFAIARPPRRHRKGGPETRVPLGR